MTQNASGGEGGAFGVAQVLTEHGYDCAVSVIGLRPEASAGGGFNEQGLIAFSRCVLGCWKKNITATRKARSPDFGEALIVRIHSRE